MMDLKTGSLETIILHIYEVKFQKSRYIWDEVKGARSRSQASKQVDLL
jgi:hypothetical protein